MEKNVLDLQEKKTTNVQRHKPFARQSSPLAHLPHVVFHIIAVISTASRHLQHCFSSTPGLGIVVI